VQSPGATRPRGATPRAYSAAVSNGRPYRDRSGNSCVAQTEVFEPGSVHQLRSISPTVRVPPACSGFG
jgi:hypothetical protein